MKMDEIDKKLFEKLTQMAPVPVVEEQPIKQAPEPTEDNGNLFDQINASIKSAKLSAGKAKLEGTDTSPIIFELERIASLSEQLRRLYG